MIQEVGQRLAVGKQQARLTVVRMLTYTSYTDTTYCIYLSIHIEAI